MYLTKLFLNPTICRRENLRDAYSLHKLVYSCFPKTEEKQNFLYADKGAVRGGRLILMLSDRLPVLPESAESATTELTENFFHFTGYRFEIILNPVRRDSGTGKRCPITGQLNLLQWFLAKNSQWGFETDSNTLDARTLPAVQFPKDGRICTFHAVQFRGCLKVTDMDLFRKAVASGIGHGKAFGFGLLQLVPVQ